MCSQNIHLAITITNIVEEATLVEVARWPNEDTLAVLLVVLVITLVGVVGGILRQWVQLLRYPLDPLAQPMSVSIPELTTVLVAILPQVRALTLRLTIQVLTVVHVGILEVLDTTPMLQVGAERTHIAITECVGVGALAINASKNPITFVGVAVGALPLPHAMPESIDPLALVLLSVCHLVDAEPYVCVCVCYLTTCR